MIRFENVTRTFGSTTAVKNLNLSIQKGDFCCLIGPSGCGKSTTLKMINRMVQPTSGRILVNGEDIGTKRPERLRRTMGYVIQSIGLFPHMSVTENICVVPRLLGWAPGRAKQRANELLEMLGLPPDDYARSYPGELSGGEAQRVGVARALAADPEILLMDEPFGSLDPITRDRLQTAFARIQRDLGKTVVFVTHDIDEAIRLASSIALMKDGELIQHETPELLLSAPANAFVRQFIGSDRALKKLARIPVGDHFTPAVCISLTTSIEAIKRLFQERGIAHSVWVEGEDGRLTGWLDKPATDDGKSVAQSFIPVDPHTFSLRPDATLKQALAAFIRHGVACLPVVNDDQRVLGELCLHDIISA